MKLIWTPEGADPREWDFKPGRLDVDEVTAIEDKTGLLFPEWSDQLFSGGAKAFKGLLWVLMRRDNPTLRWDQVRFAMADIRIDFDDAELRERVDSFDAQIAAGDIELDEDLLAYLERLRAIAYPPKPDGEAAPEDDGPKASRSRKSSGSTSSTSRAS